MAPGVAEKSAASYGRGEVAAGDATMVRDTSVGSCAAGAKSAISAANALLASGERGRNTAAFADVVSRAEGAVA